MNTLTYNLKNDINTYVMTCNDELLDMYKQLLIDEGAYKIYVNNELVYQTYEKTLNDEQFETFIKLLTNGLVYRDKKVGEQHE